MYFNYWGSVIISFKNSFIPNEFMILFLKKRNTYWEIRWIGEGIIDKSKIEINN